MTPDASTSSLELAPEFLSLTELWHVAESVAEDRDRWSSLVRFRPEGRWWTRLYGDHALDVWLLTWLTDQSTDLHDHGASAAAFTVVQGELSEVRTAGPLEERRRVVTGQTTRVEAGVIHDVRNPCGKPAVSIHAYSPPLREMTYYLREPSGRLVVDQVIRRQLEP